MVASLVLSCVSYRQDLSLAHSLTKTQAFSLAVTCMRMPHPTGIWPCFHFSLLLISPSANHWAIQPITIITISTPMQVPLVCHCALYCTDKRDGEHPLVSHCALHWQERWRAVVNDECDFHFKIVPTSISSLVLMSLDYFQHSHCRRCHPWNQHWNL